MSESHPLRPLPARPSLELERKHARALLRRLRAGDPEAMARATASHPTLDTSQPDRVRLADAQLVLSREYGFASWPKLVHWFERVERQRYGWKQLNSGDDPRSLESWVRTLIAEHRDRRTWTAHTLAAHVPRFYGAQLETVFSSTVTEDEARLAVARQRGFPSWQVLLDSVAASSARQHATEIDPMRFAAMAIEEGNVDELRRIVEQHPDLLHPLQHESSRGRHLLATVAHHEKRRGVEAMRTIREWLEAQGLDYQLELNQQLCGHMRMSPEKVRWLLDRGADPNWIAPNGASVLEHALIRYWNGEAADLVAARAAIPHDVLWIAAGIGDVEGVSRALSDGERSMTVARRRRPPLDVIGPAMMDQLPEPDDEELLREVFLVAMLNGRTAVLEELVTRGFPLNSLAWGQPMINFAVGNFYISVVECLVRLGADLDLRGWRPELSARELARELFEQDPDDADRRRMIELLGLDAHAIVEARNARPPEPVTTHPLLQKSLELAGNDAFRLRKTEIHPENLLYGVLRATYLQILPLRDAGREGLGRYAEEVGARVQAIPEHIERPPLPMHPDAQGAIDEMYAFAAERRRSFLTVLHLLHALARTDRGAVAELLARYGSSAAAMRDAIEPGL